MDAAASALKADLEVDRREFARVAKEADEVEAALAAAVGESDLVLADKAVNDKRIEVSHNTDQVLRFYFALLIDSWLKKYNKWDGDTIVRRFHCHSISPCRGPPRRLLVQPKFTFRQPIQIVLQISVLLEQ